MSCRALVINEILTKGSLDEEGYKIFTEAGVGCVEV